MLANKRIAVIGLGYVGLPLAVEFSKKYSVIGFDINKKRIDELNSGFDITRETDSTELLEVLKKEKKWKNNGLYLSNAISDLGSANIYIVTVPTPVDESKRPNLSPLILASKSIGSILKKGDIVIYESTTYPGCTEEECVPVLEHESGLKFNIDFFCGYSPERINPGDKVNTLTSIKKVTSGSTLEIADLVDKLYQSIITAGTYRATSIKVAEASKAVENAQRDVNISFVNELALIFDKLGIDTHEVLDAASTKWNFLKYKPGLVGGHCIGVDPYYLAFRSEQAGYHPAVILSGRRVNDRMGEFVANKMIKKLIAKGILIKNARILILGITFKENCPDVRNTKIIDIHSELIQFGCIVDIYDPWANVDEVKQEFGIDLIKNVSNQMISEYQGVIIGVAHSEFIEYNFINSDDKVIFDLKGILPRRISDCRL